MLCGLSSCALASPASAAVNLLANPAFDTSLGGWDHARLINPTFAWTCWFTFDLDGNRAWIRATGTIIGNTINFRGCLHGRGRPSGSSPLARVARNVT
jgi:hypothetical protein